MHRKTKEYDGDRVDSDGEGPRDAAKAASDHSWHVISTVSQR